MPTPERPAATTLGPAEPWFCGCRDARNLTILRPASCERCPRCGEFAPWARPKANLMALLLSGGKDRG